MELEKKVYNIYKEREISDMCAEQYHTILTNFEKKDPEVKKLFDNYLHESRDKESLIYIECLKYCIDSNRFNFLEDNIKQAYFNIAKAYERNIIDYLIERSR